MNGRPILGEVAGPPQRPELVEAAPDVARPERGGSFCAQSGAVPLQFGLAVEEQQLADDQWLPANLREMRENHRTTSHSDVITMPSVVTQHTFHFPSQVIQRKWLGQKLHAGVEMTIPDGSVFRIACDKQHL